MSNLNMFKGDTSLVGAPKVPRPHVVIPPSPFSPREGRVAQSIFCGFCGVRSVLSG